MSGLLILGAGGHGKVILEIAKMMYKWGKIAFLDDDRELKMVANAPVIGPLKDYVRFTEGYKYAFVAIGDNLLRMELQNQLEDKGYNIPVLIHPFSFVSETVHLGEGTVVMPGVVINTNTKIGKGCIINTSSSIDHDCIIKDGVHISPGVHIGGTVSINKNTWIGIGSSIVNNISIGKNTVVAAGSVVNHNVPNDVMVAGVPAVIKKKYGVLMNE